MPLGFLQSYFLRSGWLDGLAGLHASCLAALSVYLREAIRWEIERPDFQRRSLVHDSWRQLKVFTPEEPSVIPGKPAGAPVRSAA